MKPKTRGAVILTRRWGLGRTRPSDTIQLADETLRAIGNYDKKLRKILTYVEQALSGPDTD